MLCREERAGHDTRALRVVAYEATFQQCPRPTPDFEQDLVVYGGVPSYEEEDTCMSCEEEVHPKSKTWWCMVALRSRKLRLTNDPRVSGSSSTPRPDSTHACSRSREDRQRLAP
jgi:hypothetical protein